MLKEPGCYEISVALNPMILDQIIGSSNTYVFARR